MGNIFSKYVLPIFALLMLGFGLFHMTKAQTELPDLAPPASPARSPFSHTVAATGIVEPRAEAIAIGSAQSGVILEVYVPADKVGTTVQAGDPLFRVDDRQWKAQLEYQKANLAAAEAQLAKLVAEPRQEEIPPIEARVRAAETQVQKLADQFDRSTRLIDKAAISAEENTQRRLSLESARAELARTKSELDLLKAGAWGPDKAIAEAAVALAKAQIEQTKTEIERSTVRAPSAGEVLQVNVRPGEYVGNLQGKSFVILGDVREPHVRVDIDENDIPRFKRGAPAKAFIRGDSQKELVLKYVRVEPYVVPKKSLTGENTERVDTRVLQVIYTFEASDMPVYVGQQLDVYLESDSVSQPLATTASKQGAKVTSRAKP